MEITENIYKVVVPVPYKLKNVNCYLCSTEEGWKLIDTGCNTQETKEFWKQTFSDYGIEKNQLTDIYVTHYHPDHLGLAGWLQEEYGSRVHMYSADKEWAEIQWHHEMKQAYYVEDLFIRNGCPEGIAGQIRDQFIDQRNDVTPLPKEVCEFSIGDRAILGPAEYEIIAVPGHADTMIAFWNEKDKVFISADSILPHITPNVGLWPRMDSNPMKKFLETLEKIAYLNPKITMPGHGKIMENNTADRAKFIISHHHERLGEMRKLINSGIDSGYDIAKKYFQLTELDAHQVRFALSETLAHVEYLVEAGEVTKVDGDKVLYKPVSTLKGGECR
ncbi:MBL fold metallo-hydrolase [Alteribacillus sp. YIM 98480]|uniref:MBL fold metallo-hydrolase n=1 Tax=Alteribacillus sp. YIM 98480 TaxID=2606599 RepID=UPI00131E8D60|nr:MBL fold metallo-hydrolase [Alteribacillus sp. YIM 98480]